MLQVSEWMVFFQGIVSFLSPCVLPLVPLYISYLAGTSLPELAEAKKSVVIRNALCFILGFGLVFITMGATASVLGKFLARNSSLLRNLSGIVILIFGILMLDIIKIPFLQKERRFHIAPKKAGVWQSLLMGMAFSFGWTPCIGPVLGSVLMMAANTQSLQKGIFLLCLYTLGMGVPFLLIAIFLQSLRKPLMMLKNHMVFIRRISAVLLIIMGIMILTGTFTWLSRL